MRPRTRINVVTYLIAVSASVIGVNAQDAVWVRIVTDPANTPIAREGPAMVFDTQRGVMVMHGGTKIEGARDPSDFLFDTWEWDGLVWTLVSTNGPATSLAGMAYDPVRGVTVLYGGRDPQSFCCGGNTKINLNDTWEWNGTSWTKIPTGQGHVPVSAAAMAFDPSRGKVIRHGGLGEGEQFNQSATWEWDGQTWILIAVGPTLAPFMFHDTNRGTMVIIGASSLLSATSQTWEFDGVNWTQLVTLSPQRGLHAAVFDTYRKVAVLFGGLSYPPIVYRSNTFEWNGTQWAEVFPGRSPSARVLYGMAYDSIRRKTVLFGGGRLGSSSNFNDTWEYGFHLLYVTSVAMDTNQNLTVEWTGEAPPYQLQWRTNVAEEYQDVGEPTEALGATVSGNGGHGYADFRVVGSTSTIPPCLVNLRHRYSFTTDANDSVGGAHGIPQDNAYVSSGRVFLDGNGDFVDLPAAAIAINTYCGVTLEIWSTQPTYGQDFPSAATFGDTWPNGYGKDYLVIASTTGLGFSLGAIANTPDQINPWDDGASVRGPELLDNQQHYYALTVGASDVAYYIDGILQGTKLLDETTISGLANTYAYLGKSVYSANSEMECSIDEFRIYEGALGPAEIEAHHLLGPDRLTSD